MFWRLLTESDVATCAVLNCRDKVVSRFERCRTQFADASNLWLAAEASVQLLGHAAASDQESGIGPSTTSHSISPPHSPGLSDPPSSGLGDSTLVGTEAEACDISETPKVRLRRLERLKDHLVKYIHRFKPDELHARRQCACDTDRWQVVILGPDSQKILRQTYVQLRIKCDLGKS